MLHLYLTGERCLEAVTWKDPKCLWSNPQWSEWLENRSLRWTLSLTSCVSWTHRSCALQVWRATPRWWESSSTRSRSTSPACSKCSGKTTTRLKVRPPSHDWTLLRRIKSLFLEMNNMNMCLWRTLWPLWGNCSSLAQYWINLKHYCSHLNTKTWEKSVENVVKMLPR